jgi:hypothetical protein
MKCTGASMCVPVWANILNVDPCHAASSNDIAVSNSVRRPKRPSPARIGRVRSTMVPLACTT